MCFSSLVLWTCKFGIKLKFQISNFQKQIRISNYTARLPVWSTKKHKVAKKTYTRYREILFQKVVSGYLLHFAQDGSSKNALEK